MMRGWLGVMAAVAVLAVGWMLFRLQSDERPVAPTVGPHEPLKLVRNDREVGTMPRHGEQHGEQPDSTTPKPPSGEPITPPDLIRPPVAKRCASALGEEDCDFLHPSAAELAEMARCGTVKVDYPIGLLNEGPFHLSDTLAQAADMDERERQLVEKTTEEFRTELRQQLIPVLRDLGVDAEALASEPLQRIFTEIQTREVQAELQGTRKELARERAGLGRASNPRTPTERFEHIFVGLGESYQSKLAQSLGKDRAADLRAVGDGWGASVVASGACDPSEAGTGK